MNLNDGSTLTLEFGAKGFEVVSYREFACAMLCTVSLSPVITVSSDGDPSQKPSDLLFTAHSSDVSGMSKLASSGWVLT